MSLTLLVEANPGETRIALLESGRLVELFSERQSERRLVGDIYKGRVTRVLPGMQSAFVDIGRERMAFLYGADVIDPDQPRRPRDDHGEATSQPVAPIETLLSEGREIVVQVSKEPLGTKGPRVTMHVSLPGRYVVLVPGGGHVALSRRIENEAERQRLLALAEPLRPSDAGIICRTAAVDAHASALRADLGRLLSAWQEIVELRRRVAAPACLYQDMALVERVLRDLGSEPISTIIVDRESTYERVRRCLDHDAPALRKTLQRHQGSGLLFEDAGIEDQIARALKRRVALPSGGYLVVESTEALTAFDVNTGRFTGRSNQAQTVLQTNREAVDEIAVQLRLRNIGGLVVLDLIDMEDPVHREQVYTQFVEALATDRAKTNVMRISDLGLIEMTRERNRDSLVHELTAPCAPCQGAGRVISAETRGLAALRQAVSRFKEEPEVAEVVVSVEEPVARWLHGEGRSAVMECEERTGGRVSFVVDQVPS